MAVRPPNAALTVHHMVYLLTVSDPACLYFEPCLYVHRDCTNDCVSEESCMEWTSANADDVAKLACYAVEQECMPQQAMLARRVDQVGDSICS